MKSIDELCAEWRGYGDDKTIRDIIAEIQRDAREGMVSIACVAELVKAVESKAVPVWKRYHERIKALA